MYGKLFQSMYDGTLVEHWEALVTFQQMIVLCDSEGIIDLTPRAISSRTGIPLEIITLGIELLEKEDPYSRTKDLNGVRIERLDDHRPWGWSIVNHGKYKKLQSYEEKKERDRERMRLKREAKKHNKNAGVANGRFSSQSVADVAHTDTYTNKDTNKDTKKILSLLFSELWERYPNKDGKRKAIRHFNASVKNEKDISDIEQALDNYLAHLALASNSWKRPKSGSTWFNNWRDWIDWKEPSQNGGGNALAIKLGLVEGGESKWHTGNMEWVFLRNGDVIRDCSRVVL